MIPMHTPAYLPAQYRGHRTVFADPGRYVRLYYSHRRQLEHIAFVDPVTGGMNNARFQYSCRRVLDGAKPGAFTVVSLNLMDYRLINEIFGPKEATIRCAM